MTIEAVRNTGTRFAAIINRTAGDDVALVTIYPRPAKYEIDFSNPAASYETLSKGASASARREIRKLEASA